MNERTMRDRMHAVGPLILRLGLAAVLLQSGLQHSAAIWRKPVPTGETSTGIVEQGATDSAPSAVANLTPERLNLSVDWTSMLGIGELGTAGLLALGLFTRLTVLPMLAFLAFGLTAGFPAQVPPLNGTAMLLLSVAGLSLFVSGGGCFCLLRRRPRSQRQDAARSRESYERSREFVQTRPPIAQRVRQWFAHRRSPQPAYAMPVKRRRWWK